MSFNILAVPFRATVISAFPSFSVLHPLAVYPLGAVVVPSPILAFVVVPL